MGRLIVFTQILAALFVCANSCSQPEVTAKSITTLDATIVSDIGYVSEFTVKCSSGKVPTIYAELEDGTLTPVGIIRPNTYQVSWTEEIASARSGNRRIRIFDEEGYGLVTKQQKANEDTSTIPELFNVYLRHPGAYNGPWVKSEFIAVVVSLLVAQFAYSARTRITS